MFNPAAARARCKAATEGEWTPGADGTSLWSGDVVVFTAPTMDQLSRKQRKANIEFAAHARSDLPAALEALEEAQGKLDEIQHHIDKAWSREQGFEGENWPLRHLYTDISASLRSKEGE